MAEDQHRGGPYSNDQRFYDDADEDVDDEHMNHLHGTNGAQNHDHEYEDAEASDSHDDDMDDDLMDKISSSPSIEDGNYSLPHWPPRSDSMDVEASPAYDSAPNRGNSSSSPFVSLPVHFPIPRSQEMGFANQNLLSEDPFKTHYEAPTPYTTGYQRFDQYDLPLPPGDFANGDFANGDLDNDQIPDYVSPVVDSYMVGNYDDADEGFYDDEEGWEDEDVNMPEYRSSSEDEDEDFAFTEDSRFTDSGWGGECLREIEDIDFEFVYALHTFVATVEGQANATKGDTMVLLDDSNSYWWLVRVVKDGSIGELTRRMSTSHSS